MEKKHLVYSCRSRARVQSPLISQKSDSTFCRGRSAGDDLGSCANSLTVQMQIQILAGVQPGGDDSSSADQWQAWARGAVSGQLLHEDYVISRRRGMDHV